MTSMFLIGFQKVFDTINYDALLRKLSIISFSDDTIKWFQSYASNRKFLVNFEITCTKRVYPWSFTILYLCKWYADGSEM